MRLHRYFRGLILAIIVRGAVSLAASPGYTIELEDGTVFENVDFIVDEAYKLITIDLPGGERRVSFTDILTIKDSDDRDVTEVFLGGYAKPPESPWLSKTSPEYQSMHSRRRFNAALSARGGYTFATGDYYEGTEPGIGWGANMIVTVARKIALRFTVTKPGVSADDDYWYFYSMDPGVFTILNMDWDYSTWLWAAEVLYYTPLERQKPQGPLFYAATGFGGLIEEISAEMTVRWEIDGSVETFRDSEDETRFVWTNGLGLIIPVSREWCLDLEGRLDLVFAPSYSYQGKEYGEAACLISLNAGVMRLF